MSKKQKRRVSSSTASQRPAPAARPVEARPSPSPRSSASSTEFNPDYSYVIRDLKRIGTLAGTFFVILIILSFILR
ncbi:MAG: hypothetical protein ACPLUL_03885 [Thermanaerothrix sp.]|jgi:hypothetical protein|uniref:Uncharacterized protein n=1 Tax=Thermanaerothrix solaris TaxID=3058434 RepID=A0ABU3NL62_9CHLR|nr:hypothetical protein [Thermanaerothrix sp. 4228-RoL]MDT8897574.1 hypothetical protein [Thermanaerothrix sp. 4228-RoL]